MARSSYRGDSRGKMACQRLNLNAIHIKPINVCFPIFSHRSPCQQCHDSVAGPDIGRSAAGVDFLFYHSNFAIHHPELKARKNCRQHRVRFFQLLTKASHHLYTAQTPHWWPCTLTQTSCKSSWWDTHALSIWQFHCQIKLKTVCYQPNWKSSTWVLLCTLHRIILQ